MKINTYGLNSQDIAISTNLVSVYNASTAASFISIVLRPEPVDFYCALFTIKGHGVLELKNHEKLILKENTIFFGQYSNIISLNTTGVPWKYHCYWFKISGIDIPTNKILRIDATHHEVETCEDIIYLLNMNSFLYTAIANSKFTELLLNWLLDIEAQKDDTAPAYQMIKNSLFYINNNINENLSVAKIADKFGFCEKHFRNLFKLYINMSPKQYILTVKLEQASRFLTTTPLSITEIANTLSFSTPYHFTNCFKQHYGMSPSQYRKLPQKSQEISPLNIFNATQKNQEDSN